MRRVKGYLAHYRLRARQRQTRTQLAEADTRRRLLRDRAAEVMRDREPSRERSQLGY